ALRYGQLWEVNTYLGLNCERKVRQGDFAAAHHHIEQLCELSESYGYSFAQSTEYSMRAFVLLEQRRLAEALRAVDRYYLSRHEAVLKLLALPTRANAEILLGDRERAGKARPSARGVEPERCRGPTAGCAAGGRPYLRGGWPAPARAQGRPADVPGARARGLRRSCRGAVHAARPRLGPGAARDTGRGRG